MEKETIRIQEVASPVQHALKCPVCLEQNWREVSPGEGAFRLLRCCRCRCCRIEQQKVAEHNPYQRYYSEGTAQRVLGLFHPIWRAFRLHRAKRIFREAPPRARVCDIGCERGELLHFLKERGCEVVGTQLSEAAARFARERYGIEVFVGELPDAPLAQGSFDAALMIHVLEHLPEPEQYLREVHRILRRGGLFWCEVPNGDSWTARISGKRWLHHDPEHHLWTFGRKNLCRLLERCGFTVEEMVHMSWEHGPFGCLQSWLNFLPGPRGILFRMMRRGWSASPGAFLLEGVHLLAAGFLFPLACLISLAESFSGDGQVVLVRARKS